MGGENNIVVVAAVNDVDVLENCLKRSPEIVSGALPLITREGYATAGVAYNSALALIPPATIVVFAHQDVYLPKGYAALLNRRILELEQVDPNWAVLGVSARTPDNGFVGKVWSTAWNQIQQGGALPKPIVSLDELLLVLRAGTGLSFDEQLPSFHLFGTDIVQAGLHMGRKSYAIDAPVIHHDKPVLNLAGGYRQAYRYMRAKWWDRLPLQTLIAPVTRSGIDLLLSDLTIRWYSRGIKERVPPASNPSVIARELGWE
jgi:hypothetical protein